MRPACLIWSLKVLDGVQFVRGSGRVHVLQLCLLPRSLGFGSQKCKLGCCQLQYQGPDTLDVGWCWLWRTTSALLGPCLGTAGRRLGATKSIWGLTR